MATQATLGDETSSSVCGEALYMVLELARHESAPFA
jgi:hypothetical protein